MRDEDLFPEVHLPLRKGYVSFEDLVMELPHNKPGLIQPFSSFSSKAIFSMKRQDQPHKLAATHYNLES
jgi:hypothetical protein